MLGNCWKIDVGGIRIQKVLQALVELSSKVRLFAVKKDLKMDFQGRLSNDMVDFVRVRCQLCNNDYPLSRMKSHTRLGTVLQY